MSGRAVDFILSGGQCHDAPQGRLLMETVGPLEEAVPLVMDRAYEDNLTRRTAQILKFSPLIHGAAYAMSAPNTYHQLIQMEISRQIANYLVGKPCKVISAPYDVRLFYEEAPDVEDDGSDDTVVQPDISVICGREKLGPEGCRGAPDMVVEILSPSNTAIGMEDKFHLYRDAGVREYWLVDPNNKTLKTHLFVGGKPDVQIYAAPDKAEVGIFPGFSVDLALVFAEDV